MKTKKTWLFSFNNVIYSVASRHYFVKYGEQTFDIENEQKAKLVRFSSPQTGQNSKH